MQKQDNIRQKYSVRDDIEGISENLENRRCLVNLFAKKCFFWQKITVLLVALVFFLIAAISYRQGRIDAERRATIHVANDVCFHLVHALRAIADSESQESMYSFLNYNLDSYAMKLAEMCIQYPQEIQRKHYNVLVMVRDFRKKCIALELIPEMSNKSREVYEKINETIDFLENLHDINTWH